MIVTLTDFGVGSPYLGQMRAALRQAGAACEVIDLVSDLPPYDIDAAAHFLASQIAWFPPLSLFLVVVDPGVGSGRTPVALQADGQWFVGPDNGIFDVVLARAAQIEKYRIHWVPQQLSPTFHGRDLFAPVAARIVATEPDLTTLEPITYQPIAGAGDDLSQVIYVDHYGNAITGLRADRLKQDSQLLCNGDRLSQQRTFSDLPVGTPFWYQNSIGLVEISVNQGRADQQLKLSVGGLIEVI